MIAVIAAGGLGTRLRAVQNQLPKPMTMICKKPVLEWQIEQLKKYGFDKIYITVGYKHEIITNYFQDGSKYGVSIEYIVENEPLGTAGALYYIKDKIAEDFLFLNGDIIFDVDLRNFYNFHKSKGKLVTLLVHPNEHPYDSQILAVEDEVVSSWIPKCKDESFYYNNIVNSGLHFLNPKVLSEISKLCKMNFDKDILMKLVHKGDVAAYRSPEYIKDMGTPDRLKQAEHDLEKGIIEQKNLKNKQYAIFLDRDGVINELNGFISHVNDFKLKDDAAEAIKLINNSGYLAIVVTNQPVIARGECTVEGLDIIHKKMETLLGLKGAYIDGLLYCPHHPDKGFPNERVEYKIDCNCRKPKPGMLYKAAEMFNIDLKNSWIVGDSMTDVEAGMSAGTRAVLTNIQSVNENLSCCCANNLLEAVSYILNKITVEST